MRGGSDPQMVAVRAMLEARKPKPGQPEPTIAERRKGMEAFATMAQMPDGTQWAAMEIEGVPCERVVPAEAIRGRVMLYLHGGAYVVGSPVSHRPLVARLGVAARTASVVPDYRLGPEHPFPAAVEDAVKVYRGLLASGHAADTIVIAGDSAGGGLTLATALALKAEGLPQPAGLFVISPWADLTQSSDTYQSLAERDPMITKQGLDSSAAQYLAGADPRNPMASPIFGDLTGLAPILIQVGSEETLLGDSMILAYRAAQVRVAVTLEVWPDMIHVWHAMGGMVDAAREAISQAGRWIDGQFPKP